jgi:hypothetical protein
VLHATQRSRSVAPGNLVAAAAFRAALSKLLPIEAVAKPSREF